MALLTPEAPRGRTALSRLGGVTILLLCLVACQRGPVDEILVLHTGDAYGYFDTCGCRSDSTGGLAKRAWVIDSLRRSSRIPVVVLDSGDFSGGDNDYGAAMGRVMVDAMGTMGYDAFTFGEWDLNHGPAYLRAIVESTPMTWVHTNYSVVGLDHLGVRSLVIERGGRRIGVIGLYNPTILIKGSMRDSVVVEDIVESSRRAVADLRAQGVDFVIALSHLSYKGSRALADHVSGVDLVVNGHGGKTLTEAEAVSPETWVVASGDLGRWVGRARVRLSDAPPSVTSVEGDLIVMEPSLPNDPRLDPLFARYEEERRTLLQREMEKAAAQRAEDPPRALPDHSSVGTPELR